MRLESLYSEYTLSEILIGKGARAMDGTPANCSPRTSDQRRWDPRLRAPDVGIYPHSRGHARDYRRSLSTKTCRVLCQLGRDSGGECIETGSREAARAARTASLQDHDDHRWPSYDRLGLDAPRRSVAPQSAATPTSEWKTSTGDCS